MLFSSYQFVFLFLPVTLAGYVLFDRFGGKARSLWLALASLAFYAASNWQFVPLLLASVAFNFLAGSLLLRAKLTERPRFAALSAGVAINLLALGYFKYAVFLAANFNAAFSTHLVVDVLLPVGISFYTFTQIAFLVDAYRGQVARYGLPHYALFVTYFPHLIAGPILHHKDMIPQFEDERARFPSQHLLTAGLMIFAIGLFKKTCMADGIQPFVALAFGPIPPSFDQAWIGALAYTFQIYFDFSGYSDMAVGLSLMFGIFLPVNFNSPYQARNIIDFWRRWHMTMTRFFTDYIYTPLAAKLMRRSVSRSHSAAVRVLLVLCLPVVVTFLLVGLWHGAGWGFIIWGAVQGLAMAINLIWRELATNTRLPRVPSPVGWLLTMVTFISSLAFFQAPNLGTAMTILRAMFGLGPAGAAMGKFYSTTNLFSVVTIIPAVAWVVVLLIVALAFPRNSQQLLQRYEVALPTITVAETRTKFALLWAPTMRWAPIIGLAAAIALVFAGGPSPFLYYKF